MSGRNGRMARAVALSARDVRRVGLTADASRAVVVERRALPTAAVATLDNGVLRRVSRIVSITEPVRQVARRQDLVALHVVVVGGHQREGPPLVSPIMMVITGGASL